jgi:hypothetical protein
VRILSRARARVHPSRRQSVRGHLVDARLPLPDAI